jgi:cell wall-associated NlpC family hydrolase
MNALGPRAGELFCSYYGVTAAGNWEGHNILNVQDDVESVARLQGLEVGEARESLADSAERLMEVRGQRVPPGLDAPGDAAPGRKEAPPPPPPSAEAPAAPATPLAGSVIATAEELVGSPYRAGGTDPDGFDCSGFVQYVFSKAGGRVPRSVREQWEAGREVDAADIAPGDLLFFAIDGDRVSHVGIALGNDRFVHAPSSRGVVRVERLSAPYWAARFAGARRIEAEAISNDGRPPRGDTRPPR